MTERKISLICEDSGEGILSAIYIAYEKKLKPETTKIECFPIENYELFTEYIELKIDRDKAEKVENTVSKRFGNLTAYSIWCCIYSNQREKADIIYHAIARGLANNIRGELITYLQDPYIMDLVKIQRNVSNEAHHFKGFLRFTELEDRTLFAKICPKNQVLPLLASHFVDRLGEENFVIYDEKYKVCLLHEKEQEPYLYYPGEKEREKIENMDKKFSEKEIYVQELFRVFHSTIAIKSRENKKLQRNLLPLRFRGNMIEF